MPSSLSNGTWIDFTNESYVLHNNMMLMHRETNMIMLLPYVLKSCEYSIVCKSDELQWGSTATTVMYEQIECMLADSSDNASFDYKISQKSKQEIKFDKGKKNHSTIQTLQINYFNTWVIGLQYRIKDLYIACQGSFSNDIYYHTYQW